MGEKKGGGEGVVLLEVPLGDAAETFDLEKTICSHGLFMMSPNHWDSLSRTFSRPLRLNHPPHSLMVSISHPSDLPHSLLVRVHGVRSLSSLDRASLLGQVVRMLRLSDTDEWNVREFRKIAAALEEEECDWIKGFGGRVFRSPTLFEDMVKCILLCNCQWSRTLSMARALCELQPELQLQSCSMNASTKNEQSDTNNFIPKTPAGKDSKRKLRVSRVSTSLTNKLLGMEMDLEADTCLTMDDAQMKMANLSPNFSLSCIEGDSSDTCISCEEVNEFYENSSSATSGLQSHEGTLHFARQPIYNFPSPRELANLDERFLAKRSGLGYRAGRIIKLSQDIVEGRIPMGELEEVCSGGSLSTYSKLADQLRVIDGFGPFTRANVLMCMGFYHVIPTDSETVRHLKQVHAKNSTIQTVQRDVEKIYGKYAPFQFLAYCSLI
ncbi:uncharacterized protein LOC110618294 isoform X4 [Manihot esculenta]|uniref:HhH-GPD domain-containing protein n=1 Tax=Manihot esculenta TaxID=3983 RepID=A0A2C9VLX4_MANES|nr:uncharacterized protein LOC110618294 isoform X4 [Manihot esculenta]OAY46645.1 hypothetical protein MANES_06G015900v8 [Manihot esculenta]